MTNQPDTTRSETPTVALGLLAFCTGAIVLMIAFTLCFQLSSSDEAMAEAAKGRTIAVPAVIALVVAVVTLSGRRCQWAFAVGWAGAAVAVIAVLLTVFLPGG